MTLLEAFDWLETTGLGAAIRNSTWLFPAVEAVHLIALASLGGAVFALDLRLLGFGLRSQPVAEVAGNVRLWFAVSLGAMFATGVPLFVSEAVKCYWSTSFWVKMSALATATVFVLCVRNPIARAQADHAAERAWTNRLVGAVSLGLWFTVAAAGRWIGFS